MHLTYDAVKIDLWEIIEELGEETVYEIPDEGSVCLYTHKGCPSCLIGHYLIRLGVPVEAFVEAEVNEKEIEDLFTPDGFLVQHNITADADAILAMARVQYQQDMFNPWGVSYGRVFEYDYDEER